MESKNYTVQALNLAAENKIPADAKAVIIAGATDPLLDQEVALLRTYLEEGGSLIVLADPTAFTGQGRCPGSPGRVPSSGLGHHTSRHRGH